MTEAEWLACADPWPMLNHLAAALRRRKRLLFTVACCRRLGSQPSGGPTRPLLGVAERFADGLGSADALEKALTAASPPPPQGEGDPFRRWEHQDRRRRAEGVLAAADLIAAAAGRFRGRIPPVEESALTTPQDKKFLKALGEVQNRIARNADRPRTFLSFDHAKQKEQVTQAALLRDLFGNLFCPASLDPLWLSWNDGTVPQMARVFYDEGRFDGLPVLADALEEAGCADAAVLSHCRQPDGHVRGCWVIDRILGKD